MSSVSEVVIVVFRCDEVDAPACSRREHESVRPFSASSRRAARFRDSDKLLIRGRVTGFECGR